LIFRQRETYTETDHVIYQYSLKLIDLMILKPPENKVYKSAKANA
jgi:hypothetical protein